MLKSTCIRAIFRSEFKLLNKLPYINLVKLKSFEAFITQRYGTITRPSNINVHAYRIFFWRQSILLLLFIELQVKMLTRTLNMVYNIFIHITYFFYFFLLSLHHMSWAHTQTQTHTYTCAYTYTNAPNKHMLFARLLYSLATQLAMNRKMDFLIYLFSSWIVHKIRNKRRIMCHGSILLLLDFSLSLIEAWI